jgi:hypothetical protein
MKRSDSLVSEDDSTSPISGPKSLLSRFDRERVITQYLPTTGCLSYASFACHIYHPRGLARLFPGTHLPIANCLLFNSHIGAGLYLYTRPHLSTLPPVSRVVFSAYGAILLNFGSILLWSTTKMLLPQEMPGWMRTLLALVSSGGLLYIGHEYVNYIDSLV